MKTGYRLITVILILTLFGCARSTPKTTAVSDEQKEKDLIQLLNARQVKPPDMMTDFEKESTDQKIEDLQREVSENNRTIESLRTEVLLKDEKIKQLESQLMQTTAAEKPAQEQPVQRPPVNISEYNAAYQAALNEFMARRYQNALNMFRDLLEKNRQHMLSDNCQYWIGECYFAMKDYRKAILEFEKVFTYMRSNKDDDAQIKLGICYYNLGETERAGREFTKLINNYPKSEFVGRAQTLLAKIQ